MDCETSGDIDLVIPYRGRERYIVLYDESTKKQAMQQAGYWAMDKQLSFTWVNCLQMQRRIRES